MEFIFKTILESWDSSGVAQQVGPAWSFANDGDAMCRKGWLLYPPLILCCHARKLVYHDDPQDVPRAVELMGAVIKLASLLNIPDDVADFNAIKLLAEILCSLLNPLIDVNLLLTEQLYYDSETFAKNVVFCILKQQKLDPFERFFFLNVGDDALELEFAFLLMCRGHNNAMNYKQVLDRLGAASAWHQGRDEAIAILSRSQIPSSAYDFETLFPPGSGIDLLCIFGGSKYPAIHEEDDEDSSLLAPPPNVVTLQQDVVSSETADTIGNDDDEPPLTFEESLAESSLGLQPVSMIWVNVSLPPTEDHPVGKTPASALTTAQLKRQKIEALQFCVAFACAVKHYRDLRNEDGPDYNDYAGVLPASFT
ncbi:hypothetical protein EV702DRAFT_1254833 [Suillus placidus]|uniref:Uncharacterized protein n=1 Tax=Suillus placidus TaxID=48579 RepID=A0A9P6ZJ07_9AGAM|nr:hypothetical protein EV702DRAFT_1254833 [Suillus placidus]